MGSVAGAGVGVVFAVEGVAEPVKHLDAPVVLDEFGGLGGVGMGGGEAGQAELRDRAGEGAGGVVGVVLDQSDLVDVREWQVRRCGQDLVGAGEGPSVAVLDAAVTNRGLGPGQRVECGVDAGLVVLDREAEFSARRSRAGRWRGRVGSATPPQ